MTSDSETDFKFATRSTVASSVDSSSSSLADQTQESTLSSLVVPAGHLSPCPMGELRCVSGTCITVSQLCDRVGASNCPLVCEFTHAIGILDC